MKKFAKCVVVVFAVFLATTTAFAQEWTKAQKEVWQVVEDSWAKMKSGDVDGSIACVHDKYQGWNQEAPLPMTKEMIKKWYEELKATQKFDYFLNPARIVVTENAAVVDYFFSIQATNITGDNKKMEPMRGKNAEFYVKEGSKWLLLGDMTTFENSKAGKVQGD
jgi:hypothetical protein